MRNKLEIENPSKFRKTLLGGIILLGLALGLVGNNSLTRDEELQAKTKAALLLKELTPGMEYKDVLTLLSHHEWWPNRMHKFVETSGNGHILLSTPFSLFSENWEIEISFSNGLVTEVKLGTSDNINAPPKDLYLLEELDS